ncbi:MAG: hypothetical protein ACM3XS_09090, partial [Bacteroidota bacterium]
MTPWSELKEYRGRRRLFVDGRPFVVLGIQFDFLNCARVEDFDYLFPHTVRLGCNTVFFPVQWFVVEPAPGRFDWTVVDRCLARCREHGLRLSLLWFGTNQGGDARPAPEWLKGDQRLARPRCGPGGVPLPGTLCVENPALLSAEKRAFDALLAHLAAAEGGSHTVILLQVENEPCISMHHPKSDARTRHLLDPWVARCYCPVCDERFAREGGGEWHFSARSIVRYLRGLLADQKRVFPVPAYVNFPVNPLRPGEDLDIYLDECPEVDIVAPDYYGFSGSDLAFTMHYFTRGRNVPFIAEHSTESVGQADRNLYSAVLEHGAVAFDPWAIDHAFGWRAWRDQVTERPFVARDGSWSDAAVDFGRAQTALAAVIDPLAAAGPEEVLFYIGEGLPRTMEEKRWGLHWRMAAGPRGKWVAVRTDTNEVTLAGTDLLAVASPLDPGRSLRIETGRWRDGRWVTEGAAPAREDPAGGPAREIDLRPSGAVRILVVS